MKSRLRLEAGSRPTVVRRAAADDHKSLIFSTLPCMGTFFKNMRNTLHINVTMLFPLCKEARKSVDLMHECGAMVFASRLRRLGDRLKAEATKLYRANGIEFNDSWFLVAFVLSNRQDISVTEIAASLGISHAAVSQMASAMERKGLLVGRPDQRDRRRTLLCLTKEGRSAVKALQPIWNAVGDCTNEMIASMDRDLLSVITNFEEQLEQRSLFSRVTERLKRDSG